jgi:hypothetical protein
MGIIQHKKQYCGLGISSLNVASNLLNAKLTHNTPPLALSPSTSYHGASCQFDHQFAPFDKTYRKPAEFQQ